MASEHGKVNLVWHLLFADCLTLTLRFGGLAVIDFVIHGCFLLLATLALTRIPKRLEIPPVLWWIFLPIMGVCLLQLVPLPQALLPYLAPVKWRIMETSQGLFPEINFTSQITMIEQFHVFKMAIVALDFYAIVLLVVTPAPSYKLLRGWLVFFGLTIGMLTIWEARDLLGSGILEVFDGTYGGLINQNHFACLCVLLMLPLMGQIVERTRLAYKTYRRKPVETDVVVSAGLSATFCLFALITLFYAFQLAYSRSGIVDLFLGTTIFFGTFAFGKDTLRKRTPILAALSLLLVVLFTLPLGKGLEKFLDRGLEAHKRLEYLQSGLSYLKEGPVLGLGLGSTEGVLNQNDAKPPYQSTNVREYHNDFLQTLVELGPIGLICLFLFLGWLLREILGRTAEKRFRGRCMGGVLLGVMAMLCFHSLISFPLRITAIRMTALVITFLLLKDRDMPRTQQGLPWAATPLLGFALIVIAFNLPQALKAKEMETGMEERCVRYGRYFRLPMFQANEELGIVFNTPNATIEETLARLPKIKALSLQHLNMQTYSVKGLNQMFMLEVLESRLESTEYDRDVYLAFKEKARIIGELGGNNNTQAHASMFFLLATYQHHLDEADQKVYDELKESLRYRWGPAKRRLNPPNTQ